MSPRVASETKTKALTSPALARAEVLDRATRARLESELDAAVKRRPANERRLAGVLRALAPISPALRVSMAEATDTFIRRNTLDRDLYGACIRALGETRDRSVTPLLKRALASESAGGTHAIAAACFSTDPSLGPLLAKVAMGQKAHLAFAAETARVARGEANGSHLAGLAPMIKESHRLTLCAEIFVPLAREVPSPENLVRCGPALAVLRGAERHLGRWLVMAEMAVACGDRGPLEEARMRATSGPSSARAAWSLVAWALEERLLPPPATKSALPTVRPTVEIVSRLSDRPSADRDGTFLFRMARARLTTARPMLETFVKDVPLASEVAVRAATFLARDHKRDDLTAAIVDAAAPGRKEELRGVATAAMCELGDPALVNEARRLSTELLESRSLTNVGWAVLVRAAAGRGAASGEGVASETALRWLQWGWLE